MKELSKDQLILIHKESNDVTRKVLEEHYGSDFFQPSLEWIQLFDKFCKKNNLTITQDAKKAWADPQQYVFLPFADPQHKEEERDNASRMIRKIIELNNIEKNFVPDPKNPEQKRWFPIGYWTKTGLVFSKANSEDWYSSTLAFVGSPFVSPTSSEAERIFREYTPIYEKLWQ